MIKTFLAILVGLGSTLAVATTSMHLASDSPVADAVAFVKSKPTMHMECNVVIRHLDDATGAAGRSRGTLAYTQSGDRFRIASRIKGAIGGEAIVLFDGQVFRYIDPVTGGSSANPGIPADGNFGAALPIPFLEALSFASATSDSNEGAYRTWKTTADQAMPIPISAWQEATRQGRKCLVADFVGGQAEEREYKYTVVVDTRDLGWPWMIERVATDGTVLTRSVFESVEAFGDATNTMATTSGGVVTPLVFRFEMFNPQTGQQTHELLFTVTALRLGSNAAGDTAGSVFKIP